MWPHLTNIDLLILLGNQSVVMIGHFICEVISLPVDVYVKIHWENAKSTCHTATDKVGGLWDVIDIDIVIKYGIMSSL